MRGIKPREKVNRTWSPELGYAIGLLATDGCLSSDGRHLDLTSKDREQLKNFLFCLGIKNRIGRKISGYSGKFYPHVQFGDVVFYRFLMDIGLTPAKSKTLGALDIPQKYFFDFLRGAFDGDGTFFSYWDPRWKSSFMFYTVFISASRRHIDWMRNELRERVSTNGHITRDVRKSTYQLKYAKRESLKILRKMYYNRGVICLSRKRLKIERALGRVGLSLF
ncbi:MAG: hypothetical protein WAP51_02245 [Candidatus Sungiibacteriota bacterium]